MHTGAVEHRQDPGSWREGALARTRKASQMIRLGAKADGGTFERLVKLEHRRLRLSGAGGCQLLNEFSRTLNYILAVMG